MTSFSKSAQLSLGPVALGVFVNHKVQVFMRGCLTVKFLGSWKTVKGSWETRVCGEGDWASRDSFSIASVGGGESTSVIVSGLVR